MKCEFVEVKIDRLQLKPYTAGDGARHQTGTLSITAPGGVWPKGAGDIKIAPNASLRAKSISMQPPEDPVSLAFHSLDATGAAPSIGTKLWEIDAVKIRRVKLTKQKGGEPLLTLEFYVKHGIKRLADWCAATPGWGGAITMESVEKSLFDGFEEPDE